MTPPRLQGLKPGDFIGVHFASSVKDGSKGTVVSASADRIRLIVHEPVQGGIGEACLGWHVVIYTSSVAFIRQHDSRPKNCACSGDSP
jgi:hypothetical protein